MSLRPRLLLTVIVACGLTAPTGLCQDAAAPPGLRITHYPAEVRTTFRTRDGLPSDNILSVVRASDGRIVAGTELGLATYDGEKWSTVPDFQEPVHLLAAHGDSVIGASRRSLFSFDGQRVTVLAPLPDAVRNANMQRGLIGGERIVLATSRGLLLPKDGKWLELRVAEKPLDIRQVAVASNGRLAVAAAEGLYLEREPSGEWQTLMPQEGARSWAPRDVRGVAFDRHGHLWFAHPQGAGVLRDDGWRLYTGDEGLPYNDFTTIATGASDEVWFGTRLGAIRFDGRLWEYRMAPRWLPDQLVHGIAVAPDGTAWFATPGGVGRIERRPMTLREKAKLFEADIDRYHRRTPYGYVDSVYVPDAEDRSTWQQRDSDNDGLWTAMYGAGECFAYAATRDPQSRQRAKAAIEALQFLSMVTQGGSHPAPPGFPARSILPTSGPNPNDSHTPEHDRRSQASDPMWKIMRPRWPTSQDGKWYWKCDTSSDELDGHFFLYAVYYDLVAETDEEKQAVRGVVTAIVDHLIANKYDLIDHDGKPTRWARFGPYVLNDGILPEERGLNSLSILSYLKVAHHMTGDAKYEKAYNDLIRNHSYAINMYYPKFCIGPGTGNQSDDEMAFMCYYNLLNYEQNPELRETYLTSLRWYWSLEEYERNPFFNYIYCALDRDLAAQAGTRTQQEKWLTEALDTLQRIPLDRIRWSFQNSHRLDIVRLYRGTDRPRARGHLPNGLVLPIDERGVEHWNHDPWTLDESHNGKTLTDGAAFLLPYYMGLYHRFLIE